MSVPAFLAAAQGRNADAARAALAPAFQGKSNGKPLDHDAQVRLLESFWLGFPDGGFIMEPTGGSGRHVITWTFKGTHGGAYLGVPPTGKPVEFSGFIIAVSDATGIRSLDWKWDPKVFTKAILGPDDVGELVVKDNFRDPSARWSHGGGRVSGPRRKQVKGKGPKGPGPKPQRAAQPQGTAVPVQGGEAVPAQPGTPGTPRPPRAPRPVLGPDGQPVVGPDGQPLMQAGKRRRRGKGKGPRGEGTTQPPMTPASPNGEPDTTSSAPSAASAVPSDTGAPPEQPKPDGA